MLGLLGRRIVRRPMGEREKAQGCPTCGDAGLMGIRLDSRIVRGGDPRLMNPELGGGDLKR